MRKSSYGKYCPLFDDWRSDPVPHRWGSISRREIWHPAWTPARRHSHRRREWLVLFSDHDFDLGVGGVDDCFEPDFAVDKKIAFVRIGLNLGKIEVEIYIP